MLFLLNDVVLNLNAIALAPPVAAHRFNRLDIDFIGGLGRELFAGEPLLHRVSLEKAERLAALIVAKQPEINAALFVATAKGCPVEQVSVRYAQISFEIMGALYMRQQEGALSNLEADRQVWRRLAA
jgi:hypothetical protein